MHTCMTIQTVCLQTKQTVVQLYAYPGTGYLGTGYAYLVPRVCIPAVPGRYPVPRYLLGAGIVQHN